ncbi:unnamed protein product [Arabidopsis thaliana]|uniref:Dehydrogenase E1 component domain-containing protein n=1 Tax=Arabidopsis thaliana TaxID=3702 RepID=A0A654G523_ARATH|nr:unnamed protein product [Arabidopsis thaliana]
MTYWKCLSKAKDCWEKNACAVTFIGDGGTSEGDFHAGLNFEAVMEAPDVFICRNHGWAISTHISEQFRSDGIVVKGQAYGIRSIRVDGNDALAVYSAVRSAREMAVTEQRPVLIEMMTYRVDHHSTSDDSTKYRAADEIQYWKMSRNSVNRFRKSVEDNGWWSEEDESKLRSNARKQLLQAIQAAEKWEKQPLTELFNDVYDVKPKNLEEEELGLKELIEKQPQDYMMLKELIPNWILGIGTLALRYDFQETLFNGWHAIAELQQLKLKIKLNSLLNDQADTESLKAARNSALNVIQAMIIHLVLTLKGRFSLPLTEETVRFNEPIQLNQNMVKDGGYTAELFPIKKEEQGEVRR